MPNQEIEVKYYLHDIKRAELRLNSVNAKLLQPRTHEYNLRFDTPKHQLAEQHKVLRLRRDQDIRLTYKDPAISTYPVSVRHEIEFSVSDFDQARQLLEALGYTQITIYEKYRTTYLLGVSHITLDEMPFGNFLEIESVGAEEIKKITQEIGLNWEARCTDSYFVLFQRLKAKKHLQFEHLTFELFKGLVIHPNDFDLEAADISI